MPSLLDLPPEIFIHTLLLYLPLSAITTLALTSKDFAALCSDETFWKAKLQEDYNFSDADALTAQTSGGYKLLYRAFCRAALYVWIGGDHIPRSGRLDVPGPRIVELAASGWSVHALDVNGDVHVRGQLDGDSQLSFIARIFLKLALPEKITQISCGNKHAAALSAANHVWVFTAWGSPYVMTSPAFDEPLRQVECGWDFIAVLTQAGKVFIWWPFEGEFGQCVKDEMDIDNGDHPVEIGGVIQCHPWDVDLHPEQMPGITCELPRLHGRETFQDKIVKVAGGDNFLIALTEGGHVLRTDSFRGFQWQLGWKYLPLFSEMTQIKSLPEFSSENTNGLFVPENMRITDISAFCESFFAYTAGSHSIVLQGKGDSLPLLSVETTPPIVDPGLQNKGVVSVVLGCLHLCALTMDGKLLAGYDIEQPDISKLTEAKFETKDGRKGREALVLMAVAVGWDICALVVELQDYENKGEVQPVA